MLKLREMRQEDSARIAELECEIFPDPWTEEGIKETFLQPHAFIAVAEDEQIIQGYCIIYHVLDEAEIARIAVDVSGRREGIGSKLLEFCEKLSIERGAEIMLLDVRESNVAARSFYEKQGFCVDGMRKNFYDNPKEHALLMSRNMAKSREL